MIVLFDANSLLATPFHSAWWRILALASEEWNVKILIPKVSFEELVGHYERTEDDSIGKLEALARKAGNTPGFQSAMAELQARRQAVRPNCLADVEAVGADLIDPVEVDPMDMVERQIRRIKPCDTSGNGYRDTLNWLTVLSVATSNPDHEVVWISDDSDFKSKEGTFHQELVGEATAAGVADRLSLYTSLNTFVADMLAKNELGPDADAAHLALSVQVIQRYVAEQVPRMLTDQGFFSNEDLIVLPRPSDVDIEPAPEGDSSWPFTVQVFVISSIDGLGASGNATVIGTVTTDKLGKPATGRVTDADWNPDQYEEASPTLSNDVQTKLFMTDWLALSMNTPFAGARLVQNSTFGFDIARVMRQQLMAIDLAQSARQQQRGFISPDVLRRFSPFVTAPQRANPLRPKRTPLPEQKQRGKQEATEQGDE